MSRNAPPKETTVNYRRSIPLPTLANHSFGFSCENLLAQNSPFETCSIRDRFFAGALRVIPKQKAVEESSTNAGWDKTETKWIQFYQKNFGRVLVLELYQIMLP